MKTLSILVAVVGVGGMLLMAAGSATAEFQKLRPADLDRVVRRKVMIDGRNCLNPAEWRQAGWTYRSFGRP